MVIILSFVMASVLILFIVFFIVRLMSQEDVDRYKPIVRVEREILRTCFAQVHACIVFFAGAIQAHITLRQGLRPTAASF
jgi:hypothetical protein